MDIPADTLDFQMEAVSGYYVVNGQNHTKLSKAMATAVKESLACSCQVIIEQPDIRIDASVTIIDEAPEVPPVILVRAIQWTPATHRKLGEPLDPLEILGYDIEWNTAEGLQSVSLGASETTFVITGEFNNYRMRTVDTLYQVSLWEGIKE